MRDGYPLFATQVGDTRVGYDIDVARAIADRMGVGVEWVPVRPATRISTLSDGAADMVIATMGHNTRRDGTARFIRPHYYRSETIIVGPRATGVTGFDGLLGQTVCTTIGNYANATLIANDLRVMLFEGATRLPEALTNETCQFVAHDDSFFAFHLVDDNAIGNETDSLALVDIYGDNNILDIMQGYKNGRYGCVWIFCGYSDETAYNVAVAELDGAWNDISIYQMGYNEAFVTTGSNSSYNVLDIVQHSTSEGVKNYISATLDGSFTNSRQAFNETGATTAAAQVFNGATGSLGTSLVEDSKDDKVNDGILIWPVSHDIQPGEAVQKGFGNYMDVDVLAGASDNLFTLYQSGASNILDVSIGGNNNDLAIGQIGQSNQAFATQMSNGNSAGILQVGNNNTATVTQGGGLPPT